MKRFVSKLPGRKFLIAGLAVAVLATLVLGGALGEAFGFGYLAGPLPDISVFPEAATKIGGYALNNSTLMLWATGLLLIVLALFTRRSLKQVPGGLQNIFEAIFEYFQDTAERMGGKPAQRFVAISVLIFLTVLLSNWLGILPIVGPIGRVETAGEWVEHQAEAKHALLEQELEANGVHAGDAEIKALAVVSLLANNPRRSFNAFDGANGVNFIPFGRGQQAKVRLEHIVPVDGAKLQNLEDQLRTGTTLKNLSADNAQLWHQIEHDLHVSQVQTTVVGSKGGVYALEGKVAGILVPYLRGASTDIHTTLSIALVAVLAIQYFGFSALGFRGYGGKFVNLSVLKFKGSLFDGLLSFVLGFLELVGEFARIISFTFRLFGNLFAGEVLLFAMSILVPIIGLVPFLGLEIFVGLIQAFIFATLTLVFSHAATTSHASH